MTSFQEPSALGTSNIGLMKLPVLLWAGDIALFSLNFSSSRSRALLFSESRIRFGNVLLPCPT